ncbi:hypothetical protein [Puniceibacterium sp. IMCC21224]|uniref:GTA head formation protein, RCAP_rcc01685 family n=1 Tax=Puniceibacterium sp. IMCC21224 TaxID=1618204 RepID=UPI00064DF847|nr:hypothetical protein [Puniceibacterium sp. IMCC21224]KMK67714.1 hypothetical protein IMCC21224_112586 [Puniceibacterium sp. IMCC21224]
MAESRLGFEAFDCAPGLRLEAHERVSSLQFANLAARLDRIELLIERLERRLWLTVYGVVAVILAQALNGLLNAAP